MTSVEYISQLAEAVLGGRQLSEEEIYRLSEITAPEVDADGQCREAMRDTAALITRTIHRPRFESCSIVNARSGKCSENCKWCAQSAHYSTGCEAYDIVTEDDCMEAAHANARRGVMRFSLVASGRSVKGETLRRMCAMLSKAKAETGIMTCASMGLLGKEELEQLHEAGVIRYHCNLETAPSYFPKLCTTHTYEDKLRTIDIARSVGLDICSGGIIGMGETRKQRAEFALALRKVNPCSIPVNILQPISGTPLGNIELISFDEILDAIAIFRFTHPATELRFAGGRNRFTHEQQLEMLRVGLNGGIVGTLLTTTASDGDADRRLAKDAGLEF